MPFTQLAKVRRVTWFWHFRAYDLQETFTRSSLALNMSGKLLLGPEIDRPHKGDLVMNLFVTLGSTINDWGWPKNGSFWTKNSPTGQACHFSKVVQKGKKWSTLLFLDHLGPFLAHLNPFGPFQTKMIFLPQKDSSIADIATHSLIN